MLYHLLYPLSADISAFNVFRYITFRSVWALITAFSICLLMGPSFIAWLQRLKFGQCIHEDVKAHAAKAGTPTMGGLLMAFAVVASTLLWTNLTNIYIWLTLTVFAGFGFIGFLDDYSKIKGHKNQGLTARAKFAWQVLISAIVLYILVQLPAYSTHLSVPFVKGFMPDLGWFYIPFAIIVLVGSSNGVNLTDGLDGLAIGPSIFASMVFAVFIYVAGHATLAEYLQVYAVPGVGEVAIFCGALAGAGLGFLWFNAYPAQVFMGDVGSLSIGGALGFLAVLCKQELLLVVVGAPFVVETLSVVLQVGYFRISGGKRFFRMAPLHHHYELKGIPESKIIIRCWIISALLGLLALSVLKLR